MDDETLNHFMQNLSPMIIGVVLIVSASWVAGAVVMAYRDRVRMRSRAELYNRLLDKFASASEFVAYLQSDTGRQFLEELPVKTSSAMSRILGAIQIGVILVMLGAGLLITGNIFGTELGGDLYIVLTVSGTISLMIGIGFLISTGISYYLSKTWGLLKVEEDPRRGGEKQKSGY